MINSLRFQIIFLALGIIFLSGTEIRAEFRTVTTLADTNDGVCDAHCSLREAIEAADDGGTIIFAREVRGGTIQLQGTLVTEKSVNIDGPNRRRITLKGNGTFGILRLMGAGGAFRSVFIDGLIIRDGGGAQGGGIYINPGVALTISDCQIVENHAARGGGIRVFSGVLYVRNSTISDNTSDGIDGAAGIDALRAANIEIANSTIARNFAADGPGGIKTYQGHILWLINSTVSQNVAAGSGFGHVGGIFTYSDDTSFYQNSIVSGNTGDTPDIYSSSSSGSNNLIGVGEGSRFSLVNNIGGNIVGTRANPADARLGPLMDNGRGLLTFAPLSTSPVIDSGDAELLALYQSIYESFPGNVDQRGFSRIVANAVDMGAVEFGGSAIPVTTTITGRVTNSDGRGVPKAFITVRGAGGKTRTALTNPFGYYQVFGLPVDTQFAVEVKSKRYSFQPQTLMTEEETEYVDFVTN
jgi:CSLREA domain-containing protein